MADTAEARRQLQRWGATVFRDALRRTVIETKQAAPKVTGTLERSIEARAVSDSGPVMSAEIVASADYAQYVDKGRGPIIKRGPGFLVFQSPGYGWVQKKAVGAAPAQNFFAKPMAARWSKNLRAAQARNATLL